MNEEENEYFTAIKNNDLGKLKLILISNENIV